MKKYSAIMLFTTLMTGLVGVSSCHAMDVKSDAIDSSMTGSMEKKMDPAMHSKSMMSEGSMQKHKMKPKEEMMHKDSMKKEMLEKPMDKKEM